MNYGLDDEEDVRPLIGRETPINVDIVEADSIQREEDPEEVRPQRQHDRVQNISKGIIFLEIFVFLAAVSVICVLAIFWSNNSSLFGEFPFRKFSISHPVFIIVQCFLGLVTIICLIDLITRIAKFCNEARNCKEDALKSEFHSSITLKQFNLKRSLKILDFKSLAEVSLLATQGIVADNEPDDGHSYRKKLSSGITLINDENDRFTHVVRTAVVFAGPHQTGKTSIFNRIFHGGYCSNSPSIGVNCSLKTLSIAGPNMFNHNIGLKIQMQVWDTPGSAGITSCPLPNIHDHMILIVVCDVTDADSFSRSKKWIHSLATKYKDHCIALFLNKADTDVPGLAMTEIESMQRIIDVYEVSAKTGQDVMTSFIQAVCKAVLTEARIAASVTKRGC